MESVEARINTVLEALGIHYDVSGSADVAVTLAVLIIGAWVLLGLIFD